MSNELPSQFLLTQRLFIQSSQESSLQDLLPGHLSCLSSLCGEGWEWSELETRPALTCYCGLAHVCYSEMVP